MDSLSSLPIGSILPSPHNPRKNFPEEAMRDLAKKGKSKNG